jgi:dinuclear metal center YbgI/SA1388 family protein
MTRKELYAALCARIPPALSEPWDHDGAMCVANEEREVRRVLCTLDVTDAVIDLAVREKYDVILSHHPLIFHGVDALTEHDATARRLLRLVREDIAVYSFHTRLDAVEGGVNDTLASLLELQNVVPLGEGDTALGRVGSLASPISLGEFAEKVKTALGAPALNVLARSECVFRVAVVGGEGKDMIAAVKRAGADTYLSGRLGYHAMLDGEVNLIEAGHYFTEKHVADVLSRMVNAIDPAIERAIYTPNSLAVY